MRKEYYARREIHPSIATATGAEVMEFLTAENERYKLENAAIGLGCFDSFKVNAHLDSAHPSELPSCFLSTGRQLSSQYVQGEHGFWKHKHIHAIRSSSSLMPPNYIGAQRVLEFHLKDGTKTDWIIVEYSLLTTCDELGLYVLSDNVRLCKVFQLKVKGPDLSVSELLNIFEPEDYSCEFGLSHGLEDGDEFNTHNCSNRACSDCSEKKRKIGVILHQGDKKSSKKKASPVWEYFTKIKTDDPYVVYAACHCCDSMFNAHPKKHGTKHLREHGEKCIREHLLQQCLGQASCQQMGGITHVCGAYARNPVNWQAETQMQLA